MSAQRIAVIRALTEASDFTQVLNAPPRARTAHFAVHHLPRHQTTRKVRVKSPGEADLSTAATPELSLPVDQQPLTGLWLGMVVPKRNAKRAVTRTLLKRRIRAAIDSAAATLPAGLWVVRLRTPFARTEFISATSERLSGIVAAELSTLMAAAAGRTAR